MTEKAVASSDAVNIATQIERDPATDEYVINGSKIWISGAGDPRLRIMLVLGSTACNAANPDDLQRHERHSIVLVPVDTPGVVINGAMTSFNFDDGTYIRFAARSSSLQISKSKEGMD